jgi:hypothetical protein
MGLARLGFAKQPAISAQSARGSIPIRNPDVESETVGAGVVLRGPAILRGVVGSLIARTAKVPILKTYELEEVGAFVWQSIDGRRSFEKIAKELQAKYKMNRAEAEASLAAFLGMLRDRGLITILVKP